MLGMHQSPASWFARHAGRGPASRPHHQSTRRRLTLEPLEDRALLSTFTVNSLGDTGTGSGLSGDLRYVITQADKTPGDNTIQFSVTGRITLNSALPDLSNTTGLMDIEGPGAANLTVSGNNEVRVFQVDSGADVTLSGLTITGGAANSGGGIYTSGTLTVANSTIDNNSASPSFYGSSYGGGIYNTGTLTLTNSTIDNNGADNEVDAGYSYGTGSYGGGIYNTGTLNLDRCTLSGNVAFVAQGGIGPFGGDAYASAFGGAIYTTGDLTLDDCTVSRNSADGGAGYAVSGYQGPTYTAGNASGGGVYVGLGTVHINGSSIEENSAIGGNGEGGWPLNNPDFGGRGGGNAFGGGLTITNQAQAWISQTLIAVNSALAGYGGSSPGGSYKGVTLAPGGDGGSASGGGLDFDGASLSLTDSSIVYNLVIGGTGGNGVLKDTGSFFFTTPPPTPYLPFVGNGGSGSGGGLALDGGQSELVNDTVSGNSAIGGPGGSGTYIYGLWYEEYLQGYITVPVVGSNGEGTGGGLSGTTTLNNTIVALNTQGPGSGAPASDIDGSVSGAYNLIGTGGSGGLVNGTNGNLVGVANPGLGPLANYGGPTQTIALLPGSPAIAAGSVALAINPSTGKPLTTDQRGFPRIVGGRVDIGAFEVQSQIATSQIATVAVDWGTQSATLQTASDGLRLLPAGRNTDLPWLGIDRLQITLSQPATLSAADVTVTSSSGTNYGPVTVSGSGTSYTVTLAQPINAADRVTITIGSDLIASYTRRLDVLPGDINGDGVVNSQDMVGIRNEMLGLMGAMPTIFGDINGDGVVDINDYNAVRVRIGTTLPPIT
jgi:Dockerin type I domain